MYIIPESRAVLAERAKKATAEERMDTTIRLWEALDAEQDELNADDEYQLRLEDQALVNQERTK
jgi:hypothetical protein